MLGDKYPKVVSGPGKPSPVNVFHSGMNKTESLYARRLDEQMLAGDVLSWSYETLTFRLANRCSYTPDFLVITPGEIQIHEVKGGYVREDGLIKWKIAAAAHPEFRFFMCKFDGGNWIIREYKS
ncbi:MAG: DUF1064 domain-containing protein [Desulfovermiculus sp.]